MSGNHLDSGIRANDAKVPSSPETTADAKSSDAMLFKAYLSGGQELGHSASPNESSWGPVSATPIDYEKPHAEVVAETENRVKHFIDSGQPEFASSASAEDRYNAFMFSDTIRYSFETRSVQVLAESHVGGLGWQNLGDVSPELAAGVSLDINLLISERVHGPLPQATSVSGVVDPVMTPVSASGQQSDASGTASVTVDTQASPGNGVESTGVSALVGSTGENPQTSNGGLLEVGSTSDNPLMDEDGFLEVPDEEIVGNQTVAVTYDNFTITASTHNGDIAISDGEVTTYTNVDSVTGESYTVDEDGNPAKPALDIDINIGSLTAANQNPASTVEVSVEGRPLYTIANQTDVGTEYDQGNGASTGPQTIYGPAGETLSENQPTQGSEFAVPHPGVVTEIPETLPLENVTPMPDGATPRPGGMPLSPEIPVPAGAITVSTDGSDSGVIPVDAGVISGNQTITSSTVDMHGQPIVIESNPATGVTTIINPTTGDVISELHIDPVNGAALWNHSNGMPMINTLGQSVESPYLQIECHCDPANATGDIDGKPVVSAVQVLTEEGDVIYSVLTTDATDGSPNQMYVYDSNGKPLLSGAPVPHGPFVTGVDGPYIPDYVPPEVSVNNQTPAPDDTQVNPVTGFDETPPVDNTTDAAYETQNQQVDLPVDNTTDAAYETQNQQVELPADFSTDSGWENANQKLAPPMPTQTQTDEGGSGRAGGSGDGSGSGGGSGASPASAATPETPTTGNTLLSH